MKHVELHGDSIKDEIEKIKGIIDEDRETVFVFSGQGTLYDYITDLSQKGKGLDAEYLYRFRVCYENGDLCITYSIGKKSMKIGSMGELVQILDGESPCRIVVENDSREQLAFIVQQLIYIEYPLERVDILLRKEERDADRTKRFMEKVDELKAECESAYGRLSELRYQVESESDSDNPTKADRLKDIDEALSSSLAIKEDIQKATETELKLAVAASKKAGKSVMVNCFIGEQIAPTSTELATPNNCFYKKSRDDQYHLRLEDQDSIQDFGSCEAIYDVIDAYFRKAQNNKEEGFALPNMHIDYVTEGNNFSSYTVYDTAGPDAAGTDHAKAAMEAMQRCDVAVFAIDYSKYLTTSEEEYLHTIKEMFMRQNKFHSLIFALNKIDVRYVDSESPKSFVMSVDFLKTRLANIDEAYRDCIIFPTCSLEYFSAIAAEKAGVTELEAECPIENVKKAKLDHRNVPSLAWLHTHSENLEYYHGMKTVSYDVFKKDSGMPALMNYVSYIARCKARDEIVNSVAFKISSQRMKLQSILGYIDNLEAFINADDEKIKRISDIIEGYSNSVENILSSSFKEEELEDLPPNNLLGKAYNGSYEKAMEIQEKALEALCDKKQVAEFMYAKAVEAIRKKIESYEEMDGNQLEHLFTEKEFKDVFYQVAKNRIEEATGRTFQQVERISQDVKDIVEKRQKMLLEKSDECRDELAKEHVDIAFPEIQKFEFSTQMKTPDKIVVEIENVDFSLRKIFVKNKLVQWTFFTNIGTWFSKMCGNATEKDFKVKFKKKWKDNFEDFCRENLEGDFKTIVHENDMAEAIQKELISRVVKGYMNGLLEELERGIDDMNKSFKSCINRFKSAIDDREKYKKDIELHNRRKNNIQSIGDCTSGFMDVWDSIVNDIIVAEEPEQDMAVS